MHGLLLREIDKIPDIPAVKLTNGRTPLAKGILNTNKAHTKSKIYSGLGKNITGAVKQKTEYELKMEEEQHPKVEKKTELVLLNNSQE